VAVREVQNDRAFHKIELAQDQPALRMTMKAMFGVVRTMVGFLARRAVAELIPSGGNCPGWSRCSIDPSSRIVIVVIRGVGHFPRCPGWRR